MVKYEEAVQRLGLLKTQGAIYLMIRISRIAAAASVSLAALLAASAADASSFAIRSGLGAQGLGMAYAGAASGGIGLSSMAWNPATITMFPGRNSNWNFTFLKAEADYQPTQGTRLTSPPVPLSAAGGTDRGTGNIGGDGSFIPASYSSWQITDQLWLGVTTGAPFGLRTKPENQVYAGQTYGRSAKIRTINISPTIGYKVNDWLSIGAAVQGQFIKTNLKQATGIGPTAGPAILDGDSIDFGYRLGATITPWQGGSIGIGYRSSIRQTLSGDFTAPGGVYFPIRANLNLPDSVVVGYSQQINDRWAAHLGVEWTNWSKFRRIPIVNSATGVPFNGLNFVYDDSWFFSTGLEYKYNEALTLRAGVAYELSAVNDSNRTVFISDNDRLWLSAGASYQLNEKLKIDLGYTFITVNKARINYVPGHPQFNNVQLVADAKPKINIVSLGITYRWDDPKVAAPIAKVSQVGYKN
jgi:long-chain fatty acid transport protein